MRELVDVAMAEGLQIEWALVTETGLVIEEQPDYDRWVKDGRRLLKLERMIPWAIGDWVNYGERRWGDMYTTALEETDYSYSRLSTFAYVCRKVEFCRRRQELSFSHHEAVASCTPDLQDDWLEKAIDTGWSVQDLEDKVAGRLTRDAGDVWWAMKLRSFVKKLFSEAPALRDSLNEIVDFVALDKLIEELRPGEEQEDERA